MTFRESIHKKNIEILLVTAYKWQQGMCDHLNNYSSEYTFNYKCSPNSD